MARPKGSPNKFTRAFKECVLKAFHSKELGGTAGFIEWGVNNRTAFYKIAARLIPHEVVGPGKDGEHIARLIVELHPDGKP